MRRNGALWRRLLGIDRSMRVAGRGRQRLLAGLLLTVVALGGLAIAVHALAGPPLGAALPVALGAIAALMIAYLLVRAHYYRTATWLSMVVTVLTPAVVVLVNPNEVVALGYLIVPALLSVTLCSERVVPWLIGGLVVLGTVVALVVGGGSMPSGHADALALVALTGGLLLGVLYHRSRQESDRRATMAESESNFRALAENSDDAIFVVQDGRIIFLNQKSADLSGLTKEAVIGTSLAAYLHPECREWVLERYRKRMAGEDVPSRYELVMVRSDGSPVTVEAAASRTVWRGRPAGLVALRDVSERNAAQAEMSKLSSALQQAADLVMITDRAGLIEYVNPAFELTTGHSRADVLGRKPNVLKSGRHDNEFYQHMWAVIVQGDAFRDVFVNRKKDGTIYYEEKTITPLKSPAGEITHFISTGKDITDRMLAHERLQFMAHHDALTQLPNRVLFLDRLKQAMARASWHGRLVAVMFMDLDRFKGINDSLGHDAGDELLRSLAERLRVGLRERDTIARFGGDEFAVLLDDVASAADVGELADKILESFTRPVGISGREVFVTTSIGISLFPDDGSDAGTLLKHADVAMYRAKDAGKNNFQFYSKEMSTRAFERLTLETSLRRALEREEFCLYYQPQIDVETGNIVGLEALLRWQHPELGLLPPNGFLTVLEETNLILPVGEWVLRTACEQGHAWHAALGRGLWLAVNVSGRQLNAPGFLEMVRNVCEQTGIDPELLELELTESTVMHNTERNLKTLQTINDMGIRLAIDDFGTGYSSLMYLKRFPLDTLKVDRTFVRGVPHDSDDNAIVRTTVALAQSLNLSVVAEGVETEAQMHFLREQGCEAVQGYLFSPPLPAAKVSAFVHAFACRQRRP